MAIDQLPFNVKIPTNEPESTGIDNLDTEVVEEEQVTWKDFPAPGTIFMRKLNEREKGAVKLFGKGLVNFQEQLSLDLIPGLGEHRMAGYGKEEAQLMIQAAKDVDIPGTIVHGIGVPLMAAGMLPWWFGVPGKWAARAFRSATAPFRKKVTGYFDTTAQMIGSGHYPYVANALNTPQKRVAYEHWLTTLPGYRSVADQTMIRRNIDEFLTLPPEQIQLLDIEGRAAAAERAGIERAGGPTTMGDVVAENKFLVKEQKMKHQASVIDKTALLESGSVPTRITEKFTLGESANPARTGAQQNVSEFLGSEAYDVIAAQNFKQMPVKNMGEYLAGLVRSGKLKKEEMFDTGLLKLDADNKVIGGTLFDLNASTPNMLISKQDVLKILKEQPAQKLKVQTYRNTILEPTVFYDLYATTTMMGNTMDSALQKAIFKTKNTAARSKLRQVQKDVKALDKSMFLTANDLSFQNSNFIDIHFLPMMERMNALMPKLEEGTQQVLRAYMENAKKINKMATQPIAHPKGPIQPILPAHQQYPTSQSMAGGFNYTEKVIYLDEAIPFNLDKGRARYTGHFPQDNPIVHGRSKTRYNRQGKLIDVIEEIQSDTIQPFWDEGSKTKRAAMVSPYGTTITEAYARRELKEINKQMEPFLPKNLKKEVAPGQWVERSITDSELNTLKKLDARKAEIRKLLTKQDVQTTVGATSSINAGVARGEGKVDFFPYVRRTGGVAGYDMLMLKAYIDDAIRTGKSGITIAPAGIHGRSTEAGMHMYYGDVKGTKKGALDEKSLKKLGKKKAPDAEGIVALKKIAKQLEKDHGIKLQINQQSIFNYDPAAPYAIENKSGEIIASFKKRQNRDFVLNQKNEMSASGEGFTALNLADGAPGSPDLNKPFFKSIVLEWSDTQAKALSKKKMSTYREGGLVAIVPKREYFAAVI